MKLARPTNNAVLLTLALAGLGDSHGYAQPSVRPRAMNTPAAAREWLAHLSTLDPESADTCSWVSTVFRLASQYFVSPECLAEFEPYSKPEDTLVSWVARRRLAPDDPSPELLDAMLTSAQSCIRCEAIDERWNRETSDNQAVWLRGGQLAAITAAWSANRLPDERLVEAFRWRDLVQVRISVNHHGYVGQQYT